MISICIPTYNQFDVLHDSSYNNLTMLNVLLTSISNQTYKDFEVIISDHSKDNSVKKECEKFEDKFKIKHFFFSEKYGSMEANFNNAVSESNGEFIKPMFQDDYFYKDNALELFYNTIEQGFGWVVSGCIHMEENSGNYFAPKSPSLSEEMLKGDNQIGSPIVCMFKGKEYFDVNLVWLTDVELYSRLIKKHGAPAFISEPLMVSRLRKSGLLNTYTNEQLKENEIKYCSDKSSEKECKLEDYPYILERIKKL